ncbi:sugar ABC transporter substrate-binding protein [Ornithinibacillus contaminans]|uniref:sugar ABC transporter substrate-binding protein n=1 Tax=Ornithinibacillus contaminans TaxID=694055 RepID=UPI00064E0014|nr:substrate-binding domain-containing protein [Ornithinibacillus contaminans]
MRKTAIFLLSALFIILCYFTSVSAISVFQSDLELPDSTSEQQSMYRIVLITQDIDTPFWDEVGRAAKQEAEKLGVSLEMWGNYGSHQEDFLKNLEIAIQSKVDGIIIQGLDTKEFQELTKVKASFYGIPIITIANDVSMDESLRRTYVGSDQYKAGKMIAQQLISDMGATGNVVLLHNDNHAFYQEQRLKGMEDIFMKHRGIKLHYANTATTRDDMIAATQDILNQVPDADAFIAVNANFVGAIVQEISKRYQVEPFYIYSFDDGPESLTLLEQGLVDGILKQSPDEMGRLSVQVLTEWLNGETIPLDSNGYITEIQIVKATDVP